MNINEEIIKCLKDPYYFYMNYVVELDSNGNRIPRELTSEQEELVYKLRDVLLERFNKDEENG